MLKISLTVMSQKVLLVDCPLYAQNVDGFIRFRKASIAFIKISSHSLEKTVKLDDVPQYFMLK